MPDITNIPSPRVDLIEPRTGLMSREWYRFFLNLFNMTGGGSSLVTLDALQIGPSNDAAVADAVAVAQLDSQLAPQTSNDAAMLSGTARININGSVGDEYPDYGRFTSLGFGQGSGGSVTQLTSRTTAVTINESNGAITLFSVAGAVAATTFTVRNSSVAATDTILLSVKSSTNLYLAFITAVAAGSFNITFYTTGGVAVDAPVINFAVIKAVTN